MLFPHPVQVWGLILRRGLWTAGYQARLRTGLSTKSKAIKWQFTTDWERCWVLTPSSQTQDQVDNPPPRKSLKIPIPELNNNLPGQTARHWRYHQHLTTASELPAGPWVEHEQLRIIRPLRKKHLTRKTIKQMGVGEVGGGSGDSRNSPKSIEENKTQERKGKKSDVVQMIGIPERRKCRQHHNENFPELKQMSSQAGRARVPTHHSPAQYCETSD